MIYGAIYDRLIDRARGRVLAGYCETHHIIPRCLGGPDDPNNLVDLTAEEHYLAHQLLVKLYPDHLGILSAAHVMTTTRLPGRIATNKLYGWLRRRMSVLQTGQKRPPEVGQKIAARLRGRKLAEHVKEKLVAGRRGRKNSAEHRAAISKALTGIKRTPEQVEANRQRGLGKKASPETRAKMSAAQKGRVRPPEIGAAISAAKKGKKTGHTPWNKGKSGYTLNISVEGGARKSAALVKRHAERRAAATADQLTIAV
jgi:hypothetical protein